MSINKSVVRGIGVPNYSNALKEQSAMCIYCNTSNYRKIYENHHGVIPKDEHGKSYDVHHIDFNKSNNDPSNLVALSVQDHYDLHYELGHYNACRLIMKQRINKNSEELSTLARKGALKQLSEGTHPWTGDGTHQRKVQAERVANGSHNWLGPTHNKNRVAKGTHPNMKRPDGTSASSDRVRMGTHNWQKRADGTSNASDKVKNKTHHFLGEAVTTRQLNNGTHPSQQEWTCEICGKIGKHRAAYTRFHGEKCRWG
jgi:hypothetical protein